MVQNTVRARVSHALAKVSPPVNAQALSRNHLFERIDALRDHQAIWISSPAGSGKTTLVSTYLEDRGLPCLWYQVDVGDDDPATFFYYLGRAAVSAVPRIRKAFPALTPEYLLGLPAFTMRFFEDLCSHLLSHYPKTAEKQGTNAQGFALVYDNCQEVSDASSFHNILLTGLARVPTEISVIFISRTPPPPVYARLLANAQMGLLGWGDLRLTPEETRQIICLHTSETPQQQTIEHIHQTTQGWAAGITLMVGEIKREGFHELIPQGSTPEEIMYYFGTELFERLDKTRKDFLLKTAFLPKMTVQMARDLTGNDESGRILTGLYRNNFFIHKHFQAEPSYEYHPLFREFLINAARETISGEELSAVMHSAASMLEAGGQIEAAMDLLKEISGYENMVPTIIEHAPKLIEQGRYRALQEWFASIPDEVIEENPWLIYWKGASVMPYDPINAKKIFEHAFEGFKGKDQPDGIILSLWGITQSIQLQFASHKQYDPLIPVIENFFQTNKEFPSKEIEGKIVEGMLTALVFRQPDHPKINEWIDRAYSFLDQPISITLKARLIFAPMFYYIYQWNVPKWELTHDLLKPLAKTKDIPPLAALIVHFGEVYYHVLKANHQECLAIVRNALRIANESGVHVLDSAFLAEAAMSCLNENDLLKAQEFIDQLTENYEHLTLREKRGYHNAKAREAMMLGDYPQAVSHARKTLDLAMEMGSKLFICVGHFVMGQALHLLGEHEKEHVHIDESFVFPQEIKDSTLNFYGTMAKAVCSFDLGDDTKGYEHLKEAFVIGREHKHFATYVDIPSQTAKLCARAIEAGIEPEYARWLIKKRRLTLDPLPYHLEGWPWPVKINTLGRFQIFIDDEELTFSRKAQKKPLDVLKTIIAGGGSNVADTYVADLLWPDSDGDLSMQSLATTLHRLRKLMGRQEAVTLQNGILSLDPNMCWIDARAFEHLLSRADALWEDACTEEDFDRACAPIFSALELYKGEFLPDDEMIPDVIAMRAYLHARFLKSLYRLGECLIRTGQYDKAQQAIERGLDIDTCAEELYRLLMTCLGSQGRKTDALVVFERCKKTLQAELGAVPSADTEALARELRFEKTH